jgi:hypothetical protein
VAALSHCFYRVTDNGGISDDCGDGAESERKTTMIAAIIRGAGQTHQEPAHAEGCPSGRRARCTSQIRDFGQTFFFAP